MYYLGDEKIRFKNKQTARVRWPDGTESLETICLENYSEDVSDHIFKHTAHSKIAYIPKSINGLKTRIHELEELYFFEADLIPKKKEVKCKRKKK